MSVTLLEGGTDLRQHLPHHVLLNPPVLPLGLFDDRPQVPALAVLHHNVQLCGSLVNNAIIVADDVGVAKLPEDVDLAEGVVFWFVFGEESERGRVWGGARGTPIPLQNALHVASTKGLPPPPVCLPTSDTTSCFSFSRIVP